MKLFEGTTEEAFPVVHFKCSNVIVDKWEISEIRDQKRMRIYAMMLSLNPT